MMLDGEWADVTRRGVVVRQCGTYGNPRLAVGTATLLPPEWLMCLRADDHPTLGIVVVGQGHDTGQPFVWTADHGWRTLPGATHGAFSMETDGASIWCVHSTRVAARYAVEDLAPLEILDPQGTSQGFLDCTDLALLWSDRAQRVGGVLFPNRAGAWLVGKAPTDPPTVVAQRGDEPVRRVDVIEGFEPRVCQLVGGGIRLVTRTPRGVWVADHHTADWPLHAPTWVDSPDGTVVRGLWQFCVGAPDAWPRHGSQAMHCHRDGDSAFFVKFGLAAKWERWALQDGVIYHVEDHSGNDSTHGDSYQFSDGRWLRDTMRVGETIDCADNHLRWHRDGQWTPWERFPYRVTLDRHRVFSDGHAEVQITYDPGGAGDTCEVYTLHSARGWDAWANWDQRHGLQLQREDWPTVGGDAVSPTHPTVPWPAARPLPVSPPKEDPPVPTTIAFPPRNETLAFTDALNACYRDEGNRPPTDGIHVDMEGLAVWQQEYLRRRVNGEGHAAATAAVLTDIRRIWGLVPPQ